MTRPLYAVILAGGRGTRFWPRSRRDRPKQFLRFGGKKSLLQETIARVRGLVPPSRTLVVTTRELARVVRRDLPSLPARNLILEPAGRNTAPAVALAAHAALARDDDPLLLVLPSDHFVGEPARFRAAAIAGARFVERTENALIVFGVPPTRPETGFGYVRIAAAARRPARGRPGRGRAAVAVHPVARFIEKPNETTAKRLLKQKGVYWNAGVFLWRARTFLRALEAHAPAIARPLERIGAARGARAAATTLAREYPRVKSVSVDVAVLERARGVYVIPVEMEWSDLGSWVSLAEIGRANGEGNVVEGRHVGIGTRDSILLAPDKIIASIGVEDLIAVDTGDVLFLCRKSRAQDVRALVRLLEARGLSRLV